MEKLEAWNFIKDQMPNFTFSHLVDEMVKNSDIVEQALQRLEAIDNLQQELGCPLDVVFKAVKQGKVWNGYTWLLCMKLTVVNDEWVLSNGVYSVLLENYAKDPRRCDSWWLKSDKSE